IAEMTWPHNITKEEDVRAAERTLLFQLDWFADPIFKGDYPELMKTIVGDRLPKFTEEQKKKVKGSGVGIPQCHPRP
ncbi:MAG: family 1 glycosylhydrolase, partial [Verrucomicrobiota bacterium]